MKTFKTKKVNGYKALVVLTLGSDLLDLYKQSKSENMQFFVQLEDKRLQAWGLSSVCEFLGINDISKAY